MKFYLNENDSNQAFRDLNNGLGKLSFADNFQGFSWTGDIEAGETVGIQNLLVGQNAEKIIPASYLVYDMVGPNVLSRSEDLEWDEEFVYIKNRASTSTITATLVFFK